MSNSHEEYFDHTYELLKKYSDDRLLLLKIQTAKKTSKIISQAVYISVISVLFFFLLLFISIMLGYFFSDLTGSLFYGFSIIAGMYFLAILFFMMIFKLSLSKKIMNAITLTFFDKDTNYLNDIEDGE